MNKYVFEVTIKNKIPYTKEELLEIRQDIADRLQGYYSSGDCIKDGEMSFNFCESLKEEVFGDEEVLYYSR